MKLVNMIGKKVNMLTVIKKLPSKNRRVRWLCKCDCGNYREALAQNLQKEDIYSCGCTRKPVIRKRYKYSVFDRRLYNTWSKMKHRCYSSDDKEYCYYGERGIEICDEWLTNFMNFYNWAIQNGYKGNLTIDRIDNNGNYEPSNCRWVTTRQNNLNRRGIILIDYKNSKICLRDYCKIKGISYSVACRKHKRGINIWEEKNK